MSRILKYKESLHKFIKDKSCLMENSDTDSQINNFLYDKIKDNDMTFPILLLTVMNNQNKKNHMTMQGYYVASCISFLSLLLFLLENKNSIVAQFNNDLFNKMTNKLFICVNKSLQQNMESIKSTYQNQPQNFVNIIINSLNITNNTLKIINTFTEYSPVISNVNCNTDIINWYLKTDTVLINKFKTFKQVTKESLQLYIDKKYISICEASISLGWIIGGGDIKNVAKLKKSAKFFGTMYKLSKDFENLNSDISDGNKYTNNYVVNLGLQNSYEAFLTNKEKFIEESMISDTYTNTIKEIIDLIEVNIDTIIDQTSPDLKSSYSSKK